MPNRLTNLRKRLTNSLPLIRRPSYTSETEAFNKQVKHLLSYRNKTLGIGWQHYYKCMKNVWVNACIQTYIDEILNLGFTIKDPTSDEVNIARVDYFENLFQYPMGINKSNYTNSTYEKLMWRSYLGLGDAFSEVIYDNKFNNIGIGLKYIPAEYMHYYPDTDQWGFYNDSYRFEKDEIIHIKDPNIYDGVWGESKIDVIAQQLTMNLLGNNHTLDMLENDGFDPNGVVEYDKDIKQQELQYEINRLQAEAENGSEGLLILKGATYKSLGFSNRDMEYSELMDHVRDCIIATFGVPPAKVSIIETANLGSGSGASQDKQFKKTLKGKAKNFEDAYTSVIGKAQFKEVFQYNDLDIDDKLQRAEIENIQIKNGSATINEVRNGYGQTPVDWGDLPLNYTQYGIATNVGAVSLEETDTDITPNGNEVPSTAKNNHELELMKKVLREEGLIR